MNEEKYNLLNLIDTQGYLLDIFDFHEKEQQLRELLDDNLIYVIEEPYQSPKFFLTSHAKERLEDYQKSANLQKSVDDIRTSLNQEKQDRTKADNSARHISIATIIIAVLTLAAAIIAGLFSAF